MRIERPKTTLSIKEAIALLGITRQWFRQSKLDEFLSYYQEPGRHRAYLVEDVEKFAYWMMIRRGMIALGHWGKTSSRLLPPGDTMQEKRDNFEAWLEEDPHGAVCPECGGGAVQGDGAGPIWCERCSKIAQID